MTTKRQNYRKLFEAAVIESNDKFASFSPACASADRYMHERRTAGDRCAVSTWLDATQAELFEANIEVSDAAQPRSL